MAISAQKTVPFKVMLVATLAGLPGAIDPSSPINWSYAPASAATITPSADGLTADVVVTESGILSVSADGNLGQGLLELTASEEVTAVDILILGADAVAIEQVV
jgi:hypothetical protein